MAQRGSSSEMKPTQPPRHRPLVPVLGGFALGIALDGALRPVLWAWLVLAVAALLPAVWAARRGLAPWGNWVLAVLLLVPFGGFYHAARFRHKPAGHLRNLSLDGEHLSYLRAEVTREPERHYRWRAFSPEDMPPEEYWLVRVEVEALSADRETWRATAGGMAVFVNGGRPRLNVGDRVEFLARPWKNRAPTNPGQRDMALVYERIGSYAAAAVESPSAFHVLSRSRWHSSVAAAVGRLRSLVQDRLERHLDGAGGSRFALVQALLFGRRSALTPQQDALLKESGTLHFLAISGLHVGLFCVFVGYGFALLGLPVRLRAVLTIALIWLYVLFTGMHVSAMRAGWMFTFLLAAPVVERQRDAPSALAGAALIILLISPQQLFAPGFQLTFVAVWAMACIYPQLLGILWPWQDFVARLRQPEERTVRSDLWEWTRSMLVLTCSVWVATAPIRAYYFNSLCVFAPLLNVLVWPLVLLLLLACFVLVITVLLGGLGTGAVAWVALLLSENIETLLQTSAWLPGFGVYMPSPPAWWIGLFCIALGAWVLRGRLHAGRKVAVAAALVLGASFLVNDVAARLDRPFRLTVADVGAGQAALLQVPEGQTLLFDAGSFRQGAEVAVAELLWHERVRHVNVAVASHLNTDHCNFLPFLSRRFEIDQIIAPATGFLPPFQRLVRRTLRRHGPALRDLSEGAELIGGGLRCVVLHPNSRFAADPAVSENDRSLVLLGCYEGLSFLLPGDAQSRAIRRLSRDYGDRLMADVLVMPHHGRYHAGLDEFVGHVRPAVALVSGREEDCHARTREVLRERGVPLWITEREGAIIVTLRQGKATVAGHASGRTMEFYPLGTSDDLHVSLTAGESEDASTARR